MKYSKKKRKNACIRVKCEWPKNRKNGIYIIFSAYRRRTNSQRGISACFLLSRKSQQHKKRSFIGRALECKLIGLPSRKRLSMSRGSFVRTTQTHTQARVQRAVNASHAGHIYPHTQTHCKHLYTYLWWKIVVEICSIKQTFIRSQRVIGWPANRTKWAYIVQLIMDVLWKFFFLLFIIIMYIVCVVVALFVIHTWYL